MFPLKDTIRSRSAPIMNYAIIVANLVIFAFEATMGPNRFDQFTFTYGMVPRRLLTDLGPAQLLTIFTSMFLHGGWFHVLSNMWALFIFGDNIEDRMGHFRYLAFYLICGVVAALAHLLSGPNSVIPTVGASGAISGIMGAYVLLFPRSRVVTFIPVFILPWLIEVPALVFIGFWFLSQVANGLFSLTQGAQVSAYGGVAVWAHVGGFLAGMALVYVFARRNHSIFRATE